jgi:creatinine amidohydrolase
MIMLGKPPYDYAKLTWPEVNEAVQAGKVAILPVGMIEDHGPHLPIDTDVVIATTVCRRAADLVTQEIVLLPPIVFGYSPHHLDGPGTLTIGWDTFVKYVRDVTTSLVYHGFKKILIVNGHGSNRPHLELAARLTVLENPDVHCAFLSWWDMRRVRETFNGIRESQWTSHACELETSVYLAAQPEYVHMDRATRDYDPYASPHFWSDLAGRPPEGYANPVVLVEYWSTVSETGTRGDPTVATPEKGEAVLKAAAQELADIVRELKARPIRDRNPHQTPAVQAQNARTRRGPGLEHIADRSIASKVT